MNSNSTMAGVATDVGGNAVFIKEDLVYVACIYTGEYQIIGTMLNGADADYKIYMSDFDPLPFKVSEYSDDDAEQLGSRNLAAGGRALAKQADNQIALVKGASGWVGVRA